VKPRKKSSDATRPGITAGGCPEVFSIPILLSNLLRLATLPFSRFTLQISGSRHGRLDALKQSLGYSSAPT
jgi:hypothetical protein